MIIDAVLPQEVISDHLQDSSAAHASIILTLIIQLYAQRMSDQNELAREEMGENFYDNSCLLCAA